MSKRREFTQEETNDIIRMYTVDGKSQMDIIKKYKIGKLRMTTFLQENNIEIIVPNNDKTKSIENFTIPIIIPKEGYELLGKCKQSGIEIPTSGDKFSSLFKPHIKKIYGEDAYIPSNRYQEKKYYIENGKQWVELYFDIIEKEKLPVTKCPMCDWETTDIINKTGCFENHIKKIHRMNIIDYLDVYPEDSKYHPNTINTIQKKEVLDENDNHVVCKICGDKMKIITETHLISKHNITHEEYRNMFPNEKMVSKTTSKNLSITSKKNNELNVCQWSSKAEKEILSVLELWGIGAKKAVNNSLLKGKEIDIIIPNLKIGIEYNGLYWHSEKMGKLSNYHLDKTLDAKEIGYDLIHIFEDEWMYKKEIVISKLKDICKVDNKIKIGARECDVIKITPQIKNEFLNNHYINGEDNSNIHYGAYYNEILIGVMTFSNKVTIGKENEKENQYLLSSFSVHNDYFIYGLMEKFFKKFLAEYNPSSIISFLDRRWDVNTDNNIYSKLGFNITGITRPTSYYVKKNRRYRVFGKAWLKRNLPNVSHSKPLHDIMLENGYVRIWDCGLFKYEFIVSK